MSIDTKTPNINVRSTDWVELRIWLNKRIEMEKTRVMDGNLTPEETARIRGTYNAFREVLGLEDRVERVRKNS